MNRLLSILFLLSVVLFTNCTKNNDSSPEIPVAALRIVNAYTDAEAVGLTVDNNYITAPGAPLLYNTFTSNFTFLYPGSRRVKVYKPSNTVISDKLVIFKDSTYYTSFVFGNTIEAKNLIVKDTVVKDLGNKAALRFFHLASNIENVNVYLDNTDTPIYASITPAIESSTNSPAVANFAGQTSGKHKVIITDDQNNMIVEREYDFRPGRYYSIILSGDKNSTNKPPYLGIIPQF